MRTINLRRAMGTCAIAALPMIVTACGGGSESDSSSTKSSSPAPEDVSLQLDWTPSTNYTGFYVAQDKGFYEEAGVNLKILPYSETAADTIVGAGKANCGITEEFNLPVAVAAGSNEISVMPILQHDALAVIVKSDSSIKSPKELSGKTYGGFGLPFESPVLKTMITSDGGSGEVKTVTLNTGAYEAVYNGRVDSSLAYRTWELLEAKEKGIQLREFPLAEYGVPDAYSSLVACNGDWLKSNPDLAKRFVEATAKGYEYAMKDPDGASEIIIAANPGAFPSEELVHASANLVATDYYPDANGVFGCQTEEEWKTFTEWLFENEIMVDTNGNPLAQPPDLSTLYSTEYEPSACEKGS